MICMFSDEITLVCIGPLTNLALALRLDPSFGRKLKECYIMGGNYSGHYLHTCRVNIYTNFNRRYLNLIDLSESFCIILPAISFT